jgi:chromatin segregation and condensation protein Rec8/ScpA/Scc1 (kleisin family)
MEAAQLRASPAGTPEENPTLSQMVSLEQARRHSTALLARQKSERPFHQARPTIAELPEPAEVRVFDLVRTFEEVLEKVRHHRSAESPQPAN